jgi:sigma-54 dependent transcriptional regulator, flagellar regulatory protein
MDTHSHFLVNDDCNCCHYVANAFTLLKVPIIKITLSAVLENPEIIAHAISMVICKNVNSSQIKQLNQIAADSSHVFLISLSEQPAKAQKLERPMYFLKVPFSVSDLKNTLSQSSNQEENLISQTDLHDPLFERLVGKSKQISMIKSYIKQVAESDTTVLISGESGTGKEVIASCIHHLSLRKYKIFVPINCGAIPSELMESELFGHEKGAFTGAATRRQGRFEMANLGSLFLDEIGDMPLPMQVKLLRVIQERKIERVGSTQSIDVNVRLIAATNRNLQDMIQQNTFREDLFYRLNVFPIQVPSLHERSEDIPMVIEYHLDKIHERLGHRVVFTERALEMLCHYPWPGNIRELANFLERMVILHRDCVLDEKDLDAAYKQKKNSFSHIISHWPSEKPFNIKEYISRIEQQLIKVALERSNGIVHVAAEYLSMGKAALLEKIKKYKINDA